MENLLLTGSDSTELLKVELPLRKTKSLVSDQGMVSKSSLSLNNVKPSKLPLWHFSLKKLI